MTRFRNPLTKSVALTALVFSLCATYVGGDAGRSFASSTPQNANCGLAVTHVDGALDNFILTGNGTTTITVQSCPNCTGLQSIDVTDVVNTNVVVGAFSPGTFDPVTITASAVNPNLPSGFTITAHDLYHLLTIGVVLDCAGHGVRGCTLTQGYWKNHPTKWPVSSLTLGSISYSKTQLISILQTPVKGNGIISLSYQLIAAKLNAASGTTVPSNVQTAIANADALISGQTVPPIGSGYLAPTSTAALTTILDTYNNGGGAGAPPHCGGDSGTSGCPN